MKNGHNYTHTGLVDSGSPINLVKMSKVTANEIQPIERENFQLKGINSSMLKIVGHIDRDIIIDGIQIRSRFYVVPNETMSCNILFGRELLSNPQLQFVIEGEELKAKGVNPIARLLPEVYGILNIEYGSDQSNIPNLEIGPQVNVEIKKKLYQIFENKYFKKQDEKTLLDFPEELKMKIRLKEDKPFKFNPRRLSYKEKHDVREILDDFLDRGIIQPSVSDYCSPIVLTKKRSGETRLCVDLRTLNSLVYREHFPIPSIDDQIDSLREKKVFTKLDLKDSFFNVMLSEESMKYTSFATPHGQFEFRRAPFGFCNSPSAFQRFLNYVFEDMIRKGWIQFYIDDGVIATETEAENLEILSEVFQRLNVYNLELRLDKCLFLMSEITHLGYIVDKNGVKPSEEHIRAVLDYPVPQTVHDVQRFIGMVSYFRRFIENFAATAKPLYDIIKNKGKFVFNEEALISFEKLKNVMGSRPLLAIYSPELETELHCDASAQGYGAILMQKQKEGFFKPVFYFSKRTTDLESKYHSFELELLAIINAIKRYRVYLQGIKFKILTDCNAIKCALNKKDIIPRIARWVLELSDYDYTIEHRSNEHMRHVDALSRVVLVIEDNTIERNLSICQQTDPEIESIRINLEEHEDPVYELRNGLVYRKEHGKSLFVVPQKMEFSIIKAHHDDTGHVGSEKCYRLINKLYWFTAMKKKIKEYVQNCLKCIAFNSKSGRKEGFLNSIEKVSKPFDTIHIDHLGPLNKTARKNQHLLVIIDAFTKHVRLYPTKTTKVAEVIRHLECYFSYYSRPRRIVSDRGSCFTSNAFLEFCQGNNIQHVKIATGVPRANGQVERVNRTVKPMISKVLADKLDVVGDSADWDLVLEDIQYSVNNTWCRVTGSSPNELLFGAKQRNDFDAIENLIDPRSERANLLELREEAHGNQIKSQDYNKVRYDKTRKASDIHKVGDYVMIKNIVNNPGSSTKLSPLYKGPYRVKKVLDKDRVLVEDVPGFQLSQIPYTGTIATENIKKWMSPPAAEDSCIVKMAEL